MSFTSKSPVHQPVWMGTVYPCFLMGIEKVEFESLMWSSWKLVVPRISLRILISLSVALDGRAETK